MLPHWEPPPKVKSPVTLPSNILNELNEIHEKIESSHAECYGLGSSNAAIDYLNKRFHPFLKVILFIPYSCLYLI